MLTIFSTPKPFHGHIGVIQRNALKSWTLLHPDVEVILFGEDDGAAEVCRELGLRHEVQVERGGSGLKRIDYMFGKAQAIARHDVLCYVNCDIVLTDDFIQAAERVRTAYAQFLMVGRRWDTPIMEPVEFSDANWREKIRAFALSTNDQRDGWWIDYFLFSRGLYGNEMPAFVIGTVRWDNWLLWKALDLKLPVVDASQVVLAVHQNHDYSYHPRGKGSVGGRGLQAEPAVGRRMAPCAQHLARDAETDGWRANSRDMAAKEVVRGEEIRFEPPLENLVFGVGCVLRRAPRNRVESPGRYRCPLEVPSSKKSRLTVSSMSMPRISVLIDTYNHERYIEQAIVSVLEQDFPREEMEIVVVDDGSTDSTPSIIEKFLPSVRYIRKKNGGQASAFNAACRSCSGSIVAFLDGDDWWAKEKLIRRRGGLRAESGDCGCRSRILRGSRQRTAKRNVRPRKDLPS